MKSSLAEFEYSIYPSRLCLSFVGIWPNLYDSRSFAVKSNILMLFWWTASFSLILIPQTWKLFLIGNDLDAIINVLSVVDLPVVAALAKMGILRYYSREVKLQLKSMIKDWMSPYSTEHTTTIYKSALIGRWIALGCIATGYFTGNVNVVNQVILLHEKKKRTGHREMFFESHFPVNVSNSPWFEITWCMQALTALHAVTGYSGIDGLFAVLVLHLCGQLTVLEDQLIKLPEESSETVAVRIKRIVARHNQLIKFAVTIERTFNFMLLVQILVCTIQFCLQFYQIINVQNDSTVAYPRVQQIFVCSFIVYMMFDLFIYCFVAEILREKSLSILHAIYNSRWYKLRPKDVRDLIMIANRAQYPLEVTAGKFCPLSLDLFAVICKTSFGYLSMLLAVREKT